MKTSGADPTRNFLRVSGVAALTLAPLVTIPLLISGLAQAGQTPAVDATVTSTLTSAGNGNSDNATCSVVGTADVTSDVTWTPTPPDDPFSGTWASTVPVGFMIVKASNTGTLLVSYVPAATSGTYTTAGIVNHGGQQPALSHLTFCAPRAAEETTSSSTESSSSESSSESTSTESTSTESTSSATESSSSPTESTTSPTESTTSPTESTTSPTESTSTESSSSTQTTSASVLGTSTSRGSTSASVLGTSTSRGSSQGASVLGTSTSRGSGATATSSLGVAVLGENITRTPTGSLPFTGPNLPVGPTVLLAGLLAAGGAGLLGASRIRVERGSHQR